MASLKKALKKTLRYEGEYSNDPDDLGGETYYGISRKYNLNWNGWKAIDALEKPHPDDVYDFYRDRYWNQIRGDELSSQLVADNIFDFAVNAGVFKSVLLAQRAANVLQLYRENPILIMDGIYGDKTHAVIASIGVEERFFCLYFLGANLDHYNTIILSRHANAKFAKGWVNRVAQRLSEVLDK